MEERQRTALSSSPSTSQYSSPVSPPSLESKMVSFQNAGEGEEEALSLKEGGERRGRVAAINETSEERLLLEELPPSSSSSLACPSLMQCSSQQRIINRENGRSNIHHSGVTTKWTGFIRDYFTTIINTRWYVIFLIFTCSYLISWIIFGGLWMAVVKLKGNGTCVNNVDDFVSALLFSIETQVTIGYGNTFITNECYLGMLVLVVQSVLGLILDAILLGLLFTKIIRPRNRRKTIIFSDHAVMCQDNNGVRYLEFRVGDLRKSQLAECHIRLVLYWYRNMGEGRYSFEQHDLQCGYENGTDRVILLTPMTIRHKIDQSSPLWNVSPLNVSEEELEVVVVLEGVVEATGLTLQALWSYTAAEIVVGERLRPVVHRENHKWVVDFNKFNLV